MKKPTKPRKPKAPIKPKEFLLKNRTSETPAVNHYSTIGIEQIKKAAANLNCETNEVELHLDFSILEESYFDSGSIVSDCCWSTNSANSKNPSFEKEMESYKKKAKLHKEKMKEYKAKLAAWKTLLKDWEEAQRLEEIVKLKERLAELS